MIDENLKELPKHWYVRATKENEKILIDWREGTHVGWKDSLVMTSDKYWDDINVTTKRIDKSFIEISFEQFKKWVLKEEQIFNINGWYKYNNWYLKLSSIKNNIFYASEQISPEHIYTTENNFAAGSLNSEKVLLTDLSEIQQYLPDGHLDKFDKKEESFSMEYVLAQAKQKYPIGIKYKCVANAKNEFQVYKQTFTIESKKRIFGESWKGVLYDNGKWAEIVSEPKEKIEEYIPEYIECIVNSIGNCKLGGIFKTRKHINNLGNVEFLYIPENSNSAYLHYNNGWDSCGNIKSTLQYFKPSTKEAYEAQFKPKIEVSMTKFKAGDKVRIISRHPDNSTGIGSGIGKIGYVSNDGSFTSLNLYSDKNEKGDYLGLLCKNNLNYTLFNDCDLELVEEQQEEQWIPKIGDWAVSVRTGYGFGNDRINKPFQITKVSKINEGNSSYGNGYCDVVIDWSNQPLFNQHDEIVVRKALPHEIPSFQSTINDTNIHHYDTLWKSTDSPYIDSKHSNIGELLITKEKDLLDTKVNNIKSTNIDLYEPKKVLLF